jgi:ketosteroid isomerase-like protein
MRLALIPLASLALGACAPDATKVDADIRKFAHAYLATTDIPASIAMLDEGRAVTSVSGEGKLLRGRDAIRDYANQNAAFLRQISIAPGPMDVSRIGAAHALVIAPFSVSPVAAPQVIAVEGTATFLVTRRDSGWKVVHEHYSYSAPRRP